VTNSGSLELNGETASVNVVNNGANGITVDQAEVLIENGANVSSNTGSGIFVYEGGNAVLYEGSVVQSNTSDGVTVESGNIQLGGQTGGATVKNNGGNGIYLQANSVGSFASSSNQITNNSGWGILCTGSPSNPLISGTVGTVSGNTTGQTSTLCKTSP
jgi:Periplasmic copper-binding protein (NosD)